MDDDTYQKFTDKITYKKLIKINIDKEKEKKRNTIALTKQKSNVPESKNSSAPSTNRKKAQ